MAVLQSRPKLKTAFKKTRTIAPLYTSGPVAITSDGSKLATCVAEEILFTDVTTGLEICRFSSDTQPITALCITPASNHLLAFTASLSLRIFDISTLDETKRRIQPIRVISRAHDAPIHVCTADPTSTYLASGSADGVVKVWDIARGYVTHVFKGHGGVVSALIFNYPQDSNSLVQSRAMRLITASVDTRIRIFNLTDGASTSSGGGKPEATLEGHVSVPRGLDVSPDGKWLLSGGRDSVVLLWDLDPSPDASNIGQKKSSKFKASPPRLANTIPVLERIEAAGFLKDDSTHSESMTPPQQFYAGGEKGFVKIWNTSDGQETFSFGREASHISKDQEEQRQIANVLYLPTSQTIISIHADQNIMFYSVLTHTLSKQLIGYNDEIVDATFVRPPESLSTSITLADNHGCLALATNSSLIRVYSTENLDARLLDGHTDIVLALSSGRDGYLFASGSKDRSARIWAPTSGSEHHLSWGFTCVAICEGHTESVGAVAMSRVKSDSPTNLRFMFTGSQDRTIKMWDLSNIPNDAIGENEVVRCKSLTTLKAHERDINSLDVSPNDRLLVSGSQDRTAKIYAIEYSHGNKSTHGELKLLGTCKGHKRGVWSVRFCRTNRVVATGSGDKSVKLWSLDDFSCLKTFEGHTNSVLRVDFFNAGLQLVTTASDGLVKIWSIQDEECKATLDNHEDKVWALAISGDDRTIVSGGADSLVTFWEDNTEEQEAEKEGQRAELILKDQEFQNFVSIKNYRKAIQLALAMGQPGRLLSLFKNVILSGDANQDSSIQSLDDVIRNLNGSDLAKLLRYIRDWNTSAKTSSIAQAILYSVVKLRSADDVIQTFKDESSEKHIFEQDAQSPSKVNGGGETTLKELVDALIPYTERHLSRIDRLMQESYVVDYILGEMDNGIFELEYLGNEDEMQVLV